MNAVDCIPVSMSFIYERKKGGQSRQSSVFTKLYTHGGSHVDWHDGVTGNEVVVQPHDVPELIEHVAVPGDKPTQTEDCTHLRPDHRPKEKQVTSPGGILFFSPYF